MARPPGAASASTLGAQHDREQDSGESLTRLRTFDPPRDRWKATLSGWPRPVARALQSHLGKIIRNGGSYQQLPPFWIPLASAFARYARIPPGILDDLLWATTCLMHAIRIEDDILDRDAPPDLSLLASPLLYGEADDTLARHVPRGAAFWGTYRSALLTTIRGIAAAAEAQRSRRSPTRLARLYVMECTVFTIPLTAIAHLSGLQRMLPRLLAAAGRLAIAGHAVDDLVDIDEDLCNGRVNLAAAILIGSPSRRPASPRSLRSLVASHMLLSPRLQMLFDSLNRQVQAARTALTPLHLSGIDEYIEEYACALRQWEEEMQRRRGKLVVGLMRARD